MNKKAKNKNLTKIILNLLIKNEYLRDDWVHTIRMVHDIEMGLHGIVQQDYYYTIFYTEKLSNVHTIKRLWQMVQEYRADLRGETWEERQKQGGMIAKEIVFINPLQLKMFDETILKVLKKSLQQDPENRFQSANEFTQALNGDKVGPVSLEKR
jgi:hypothetical protein